MIRSLLTTVIFILATLTAGAITGEDDMIRVGEDIYLRRIAPNIYVHTSQTEIGGYGMVSSNGLLVEVDGIGYLVDTPATEQQTARLCQWLEAEIGVTVRYFYATHWHADCIAGMPWLKRQWVQSYYHYLTAEICSGKGLPVAQHIIGDRYSHEDGDFLLEIYYPGPGHSMDNVVVWLPGDKILFGGCLVKDITATTLGNTLDGDVGRWPRSIRNVMSQFPDAEIVIPGHGRPGGPELLEHTLELLTLTAIENGR